MLKSKPNPEVVRGLQTWLTICQALFRQFEGYREDSE